MHANLHPLLQTFSEDALNDWQSTHLLVTIDFAQCNVYCTSEL